MLSVLLALQLSTLEPVAGSASPDATDSEGPSGDSDDTEPSEPSPDTEGPTREYAGPDALEEHAGEPAPSPAPTVESHPSAEPRSAPPPESSTKLQALRQRWTQLDRVFVPTLLLDVDYRQRAHEVEGRSGFAMARARIGLRLTPTAWMTAVGTVELVGDHGPFLLDGYAQSTPLRWLHIVAGYSPPPLFPSFRYEPVATLPMPVRSTVVTEMRVRRDVGVEARFLPYSAPIEAIVRLGNGAEGLLGNDNDTPTGYAAIDLVLGRAWVAGKNRMLGLRLGGASMLDDAEEHDAIAGRTPLGFTYGRPVVAAGLRNVTEVHAIGYAGPVRLTAEGAWAYESRRSDDDGDATTQPVDVDAVESWGLTGEVAWTVRGKWREVGRQPAGPADRAERWDGGAVELAARADRVWLGRGTPEVGNTGGTTGSLALKWWPTFFLALAVYGDTTRFDTPPVETSTREWSWTALVRASFFWGRSPSV